MDAESQYVEDLKEEIQALKLLCARAADALEDIADQQGLNRPTLIAELREAAQLPGA